MTPTKIIGVLLIAIVLFVGISSVFTVSEGESALVMRLGQIITNSDDQPKVYGPGLHFMIPMFDRIRLFDMRIQELSATDSQALTTVTKEQTYLVVEYFAKWRINNLAKFYKSTGGNISFAENLLEQRLNDIVRAEYGRYTSDQAISSDRAGLMSAIRDQAKQTGNDQGIDVLDVRIQQITLPKDVMDSVFKRMATERKQFAEAKRAEGMKKSEEIKALADATVTVIKATALQQAAAVRAQGDQEAAELYAKTYNADPKFYAFYRSLEAYEKSFHEKSDVLVLKPDGQFFSYFHGTGANTTSTTNSTTKR